MTREEAIKDLNTKSCFGCRYGFKTIFDCEYNKECEYRNAVIMAIKALEQEPKTEWIPVSERLPENKTYVLTTIHVPGRQPHARSGWYENGLFMNDNGDTWKSSDIEVIAWQPLPQPYSEVSE